MVMLPLELWCVVSMEGGVLSTFGIGVSLLVFFFFFVGLLLSNFEWLLLSYFIGSSLFATE